MEISDLPDKEFKIINIKISRYEEKCISKVRISTKKYELFFKYQTEITEWRNTITELKSTLQGFTSSLHETKERKKQGSRFSPIRKK